MTAFYSADARYRALADPVRRRLLRVLEDAGEGCDVSTLAATVGLHPNTVRGHLDVLLKAGLVDNQPRRQTRPGRPRLVYTARDDDAHPNAAGYRTLAELLASSLRSVAPDPAAAALEAGKGWGRQLAAEVDSPDPLTALTSILDRIGFEPELTSRADSRCTIDLGSCPFRDLARQHADIVCTLHLGMLRGAAERLSSETGLVDVDTLEPFVEPSLCRTVVTVP